MPGNTYETEIVLKWLSDQKALVESQRNLKAVQTKTQSLQQLGTQALGMMDKGVAKMVAWGKRAMVVGALSVAAVGGISAKLIKAGEEWNDYRDNLETVVQDQAKVNQLLDYTAKASFTLPFEKNEIQEAIRLMTIFGYKPEEWMTTFGDAALVANTSLSSIAEAFGKARVTGGQSLRMLTAQLAITDDQIKAMGWSGKAEDIAGFEGALKKLIESRFGGRMAKEMDEVQSSVQNLKNIFSWFAATIGETILTTLAPDLALLKDKLVKLYASGKLKEWAQRVAEGFKMIWQGVKKAGEVLWKLAKPFVEFFKAHPQMLKWAISAVAVGGALSLVGGGVMSLTGKMWQMGRGLVGGIGRIKEFGGVLGQLFTKVRAGGGISGLLAGKGGLLGGIGQMAGGLGGKLSGMGGIAGKVGGLLGGGGAAGAGGIAASLSAALPIIGAVIAAVALFATAWKKNFAGIRETTKKAFEPLADVGRSLAGLPKGAGSPLKAIGAMFKELWLGIAKVAAPVFAFLIKCVAAPFKFLKAIAVPIIEAIKKLLQAFGIIGKDAGTGIKSVFEGIASVVGWVFDKLGKVIDFIADSVTWLINLVVNPLSKAVDWLANLFGKTREKGSDAFGKIGEKARFIVGLIKLIWEKLFGKLAEWWDGLKVKVAAVLVKIGGFFKGLWEGIKTAVGAVWSWIKSKLIDPLVKGFAWLKEKVFKPIGEFLGKLFDPFVKAFATAWDWIKKAVGAIANLGQKALSWLGIDAQALKDLQEWAKSAPAGGKQGTAPGAAPVAPGEVGGAPPTLGEVGGAGGAGGPSISNNYYYYTFHYENGSITIQTNKPIDEASFRKMSIGMIAQEATG